MHTAARDKHRCSSKLPCRWELHGEGSKSRQAHQVRFQLADVSQNFATKIILQNDANLEMIQIFCQALI